MSNDRIARTLEVARQVSAILKEADVRCMVIGAAALAVHGYARQSVDLDLATYENPFENFKNLVSQLSVAGFQVEAITPDADDPLGGVINVTGPDFDPVQIINFMNPLRPQRIHKLVGKALAELGDDASELQVVSAELLILLKLYAGDPQSLADIQRLLEANAEINRERIKEMALLAGLDHAWKNIMKV